MSFIFGGTTGNSYEEMQRKRDMAKVLAAKRAGRAPRNVGEGLNAIGEAIAYRMLSNQAQKAESSAMDSFSSDFSSLFDRPSSDTFSQAPRASAPRIQRDTGTYNLPDPRENTVEHNGKLYDMGRPARSLYADAIASVESSGRYDAIGPVTAKGNRAYGKYQVMDFNIGPWTEKHLGRRMTPEEFLRDERAQDAVFDAEFGSYVEKYGNPQDAASVWFSGRPMAKAGNASDGWTTVPEYVEKFNNALGSRETVSTRSAPPSDALGMIGGVRGDGQVWQSFEGTGRAHASNPNYQDYSQLFREYRKDRPNESWPQVGERSGRPVFAAPDYARGEDGNYLNVSAADARQLAEQRGTLIPTRDEVRNMYNQATQIRMPNSADFGLPGGEGTSQQYTQAIAQALANRGVQAGQPIVHGKEFFSDQPVRTASLDPSQEMVAAAITQRQEPEGVRVAQSSGFNFPETQMQPGSLNLPFTPSRQMNPELAPQQRAQRPSGSVEQARQRVIQIQTMMNDPRYAEFANPRQQAQAAMALDEAEAALKSEMRNADPAYQMQLQREALEIQKLKQELNQQPDPNDVRQQQLQIQRLEQQVAAAQAEAEQEAQAQVDEAEAQERAQRSQAEAEMTKQSVVLDTVSSLRGKVNDQGLIPDTGVFGAKTRFANQAAEDVYQEMQTLKGMVVFDRLQKLKEASANGASGLGQVTNVEIDLMAAQLGAMSNTTSREVINRTLDTVESVFGKLSPEAQAYITGTGGEDIPQGGFSPSVDPTARTPDFLNSQDTELWEFYTPQERELILKSYEGRQ